MIGGALDSDAVEDVLTVGVTASCGVFKDILSVLGWISSPLREADWSPMWMIPAVIFIVKFVWNLFVWRNPKYRGTAVHL